MSTAKRRTARNSTKPAPRPSAHDKHRTLSIKEIPGWMFDNAYILTGYRQEMGTYADCFYSLSYLHNETGNIWTHFIGFSLHVAGLAYVLWGGSGVVRSVAIVAGRRDLNAGVGSEAGWADVAVVASIMVSAAACMGLSAAFHTFHSHSHKVSKAWNKLDFAGIAGLIAGSNVPFIYYAFYCEPQMQGIYIAFMVLFGAVTTLVTVSEKFSTPKYRILRTSLFVAMGLSSVIPIVHIVLEHGWEYASKTMSLYHGIAGGLCYLVGAFLYASRYPERLAPGRFDIWCQSHQIFHVLVLVATVVHFRGVCVAIMHRHVDGLHGCLA
ncbi:pPR-type GPCR protein [Chytriomyces sp. MP71]|nr:pPR-type GPCR protein [Chytriomyces sp. MP71]